MRALEYPFDEEYILKKSKHIKKELLNDGSTRIQKKIAVLGGSTTHDIIRILELFLLNQGIAPQFYESEYNMYWQDAMFDNEILRDFAPDVIYIHTTNRNITNYPQLTESDEQVTAKLDETYQNFSRMWEHLKETYHCVIIQNNFELPFFRILGNRDSADYRGRINFINRLNDKFYEYAMTHEDFYINDIHYLSSCYGLDKWSDPFFWHMYKYALCLSAIPNLTFNLSNIIKALFGKNKKALVLDLDNTLWGGIVGDDGVENIQIGQETSVGQVYSEFQTYLKQQKQLGILLNIDSKNEEENAIAGLSRPDSILKPDDFIIIKANWQPKSLNLSQIASELNIMQDSLVFVDDNPAEQEIIRQQTKGVSVPEIGTPEQYIRILDHSGFFEPLKISEDDRKRNDMYKANRERAKQQQAFGNYQDYLLSLEMTAKIHSFERLYLSRIVQLTNKSNQFNLTTRRYTQSEIEELSEKSQYLTLYGKLEDKFGDNGVVTVVIGRQEEKVLHLDLWLMSCRVLKRDMEYAMLDKLIEQCRERGIEEIRGYYYKTAKNGMVKRFYKDLGFTLLKEDEKENTVWYYNTVNMYQNKNDVIKVV